MSVRVVLRARASSIIPFTGSTRAHSMLKRYESRCMAWRSFTSSMSIV